MTTPLVTDDMLRRDTRPAAELRRALRARTLLRMARLLTGTRFTRADEALAAIEASRAARPSPQGEAA